jgi:hypothetical protein
VRLHGPRLAQAETIGPVLHRHRGWGGPRYSGAVESFRRALLYFIGEYPYRLT